MQFLHRMIQCHRDCRGRPCRCKARRRLQAQLPFLSEYLGISEEHILTWDHDILNGPAALRDCIQRRAQTERELAVKQWKANLFGVNGRPRSSMFRWLKGQLVQPHMVVSAGSQRKSGPAAFMNHMRSYWASLMNRDISETEDLCKQVPPQPVCMHAVQMLCEAQKRLKLDSVAGLDGWSVSAVRCVPRDALPCVIRLFDLVEHLGRWPTTTTFVRLQLLPKVDDPELMPEQFRPISIASVWYRWWSRYRLLQVGEQLVTGLHPNLVGGVPGRSAGGMLTTIILQIEYMETLRPADVQMHGLSLDAAKCFDMIHRRQAIQHCQHIGLDPRVLRGLIGMWQGATRHVAMAGYLDPVGFRSSNGVPQGCPLSALVCNIVVHHWAQCVAGTCAQPWAYIDDRYIVASSADGLDRAWRASQDWERQQKWVLNIAKSGHFASPAHARGCLMHDDHQIPYVEDLVCLGVDVVSHYKGKHRKQDARCQKVENLLARLASLKLGPFLAQQVVNVFLSPTLTHGPSMRPITLEQGRKVTSMVKHACNIWGRAHSWHLLCLVGIQAHRADPSTIAAYNHMLECRRGLLTSSALRDSWVEISENLRQAPRGPCAVAHLYRKRFGGEVDAINPFIWHFGEDTSVNIIEAKGRKAAHDWRAVFRHYHMRRAIATRARARGLLDCDFDRSVRQVRKRDCSGRATLIGFMADGLWTQERKPKAQLVPTPTCPFCESAPETMVHVLYECRAWTEERKRMGAPDFLTSVQNLPSACSECLWCPSPRISPHASKWEVFQQAAVTLWDRRMAKASCMGLTGASGAGGGESVGCDSRPVSSPSWVPLPSNDVWSRAQPLDFQISYRLQGKGQTWPYSIGQWHQLVYFMTLCRIPCEVDVDRVPLPSILEVYLSYLRVNGNSRFLSGISEEQHGGWLSLQLDRFRGALVLFARITGSTMLFAKRPQDLEYTEWNGRFRLPKLPIALFPFLIPHWGAARSWIQDFPLHLIDWGVSGGHVATVWRRVQVGIPGSQLVQGGLLPACPLYLNAMRGMKHKVSTPTWMRQVFLARDFRQRMSAHPLSAHAFSSECLLDILDRHGVLGRLDVLAIRKIYHSKAMHALQLAKHAEAAPAKNWHFVQDASLDVRPLCVSCGRNGIVGFPKLWICAKCPGIVKQSLATEAARILRAQSDEATLVSNLLAQMARAL